MSKRLFIIYLFFSIPSQMVSPKVIIDDDFLGLFLEEVCGGVCVFSLLLIAATSGLMVCGLCFGSLSLCGSCYTFPQTNRTHPILIVG